MIITGCVGGFITGSVAGAGLGFTYSLILSLAGRDQSGMLVGAVLLGLVYGVFIGSIAGLISGALLGLIFCFVQKSWIGLSWGAIFGSAIAYEMWGIPAFQLASYGWAIIPLAAVFAGGAGYVLSLMLIRVAKQS